MAASSFLLSAAAALSVLWATAAPVSAAVLPARASPAASAVVEAAAVVNASTTNTILGPITLHRGAAVDPVADIVLAYGTDQTRHLLNVSLSMSHPAVVLEHVASVAAVDCSRAANTVAVTFASAAALDAAAAAWAGTGTPIVLVTNHLGDCDAELERGFFVASAFVSDPASLTLTAEAQAGDVASMAQSIQISFSNVPATAMVARDVVINKTAVHITKSLAFTSPQTLFSVAVPNVSGVPVASALAGSYANLTATSGDLSLDVRVSGYLDYKIAAFQLKEFYVDLFTDFSANLGLAAALDVAWSGDYAYAVPGLSLSTISVPGILDIGPSLGLSIGAALSAEAKVAASVEIGAAISQGVVHIDLAHPGNTTAGGGWAAPSFYARNWTVEEKVAVAVNPYVDVSATLAFNLLAGKVDLSAGIDFRPEIDNAITLDAVQAANGTAAAGSCVSGVAIASDFVFAIKAYVGTLVSKTLYSVTLPIAHLCYKF